MSESIRIAINPPPNDKRCECCGKLAIECKPFGKAGDPLVGDFYGVLLLKNFRLMGLPNEWYNEASIYFKSVNYDEEKFIERYGKDKMDGYWFIEQLCNTVEASWECRDCFILSDKEYFNVKYGRYVKEYGGQ
jgi:hypothetical protein